MSNFLPKSDESSSNQDTSNCIYELSAVLVHKGVSASGGHYIAHIRDERYDTTIQVRGNLN